MKPKVKEMKEAGKCVGGRADERDDKRKRKRAKDGRKINVHW